MFPPKPFTKWSIFTPSMFLISTVSYPYFLTDDGKDTYTPPYGPQTEGNTLPYTVHRSKINMR